MQIVISNGVIEATYSDDMAQRLFALYPSASIYTVADSTPGVEIGQSIPEGATLTKRQLLKLTILYRLKEAGLLSAALAALASASAEDQALWSNASRIDCDDAMVLAVLSAIGADPEVIMAIDPNI